MLADLDVPVRWAHIVGDNLAVVRYGAGTQSLRRPGMQQLMDRGLRATTLRGWGLRWTAVRRRFNKAADAVATEAVLFARRLAGKGRTRPKVFVQVFDQSLPQRHG